VTEQPRSAPAAERPCETPGRHYPVPLITQGHHVLPQFAQKMLRGHVWDQRLTWRCGSCHDSIHAILDPLLRGGTPYTGRANQHIIAAAFLGFARFKEAESETG